MWLFSSEEQLEKRKKGKITPKIQKLLRRLMSWIRSFDLFLFDFDGLLVNTEELHFEAYKQSASARGLELDWDMDEYGRHAYFSATGLKEGFRKKFPKVFDTDVLWDQFYLEKKKTYITLIEEGRSELMPGVDSLLKELHRLGKKTCVVTNSTLSMIAPIRDHIKELTLIENWITREDYSDPKPSSQGYQKAIDRLSSEGDNIIGFEDTIKGLKALLGTEARAFLISKINFLELSSESVDQELKDLSLKKGAIWSPSLSSFLSDSDAWLSSS